ncbi:polysaccharide export protein [Flavobacterium arcticum]|uniref:Polysaccharide export protein n=1 Tax=Flavobacterium arcticum TaxID=1784713 RepID=A0A345H981_9FLAO|nr:polysaccharide biosynthesis/export family protein [Flavobacterium arcticum]AXG73141.1 polysaccharide export protein [Flavobacterium arcticum]KAF2512933.1 polysaccharide export protein [Flavobacterium arcticum]
MIKKAIVFLTILLVFSSCVSNKKIIYFNNTSGTENRNEDDTLKYANVLQPDDKVMVMVTADEPSLAAPFNLVYLNIQSNQMTNVNNNDALTSYLIDQDGYVDFAGIGKIKLSGLTRIEAEASIKKLLEKQLTNPVVNLRVINFKVSVIGEVAAPGSVKVDGDRITILEALSMAGDMTIYGKRKEVVVIREDNGVKSINTVDITDSTIIDSPFYYLNHNDVVYVKPNKTRVNSSVIGPNLTVAISAVSLLVTIIALSTR